MFGYSYVKSGRMDSNHRPLRPERSALSRLSYAPFVLRETLIIFFLLRGVNGWQVV